MFFRFNFNRYDNIILEKQKWDKCETMLWMQQKNKQR